MSRVCALCGKGTQRGGKVSPSGKRTKRKFKPNLRRVKVMVDGKVKRLWVCAKCLKAGKVKWEEE